MPDYIQRLIIDIESESPSLHEEFKVVATGEALIPGSEALARNRLLSAMMKPAWFHTTLSLWEGPKLSSNTALVEELKLVGGKLFDASLVSDIEEWDQWCLEPLALWRMGKAPCTTITFDNDDLGTWFILSPQQMIAYLSRKIE